MKTSNQVTDLADLLRWRQEHQPDRLAFTFLGNDLQPQETATYGQLAAEAEKIAAHLHAKGVRREPVILAHSPGLNFVRSLWGILMSGGIAVPAYPPVNAARAAQLEHIARDCGARFALGSRDIGPVFADHCPPIGQMLNWLCPEDIANAGEHSFAIPDLTGDAPAILQYTSGSTNHPKGVILTHRGILANSWSIQRAFIHTSKSRGLIWLPPYHDMGLIGGIIQPVYAGFHTSLMSPRTFLRDPLNWLRAISETKASTSGGPNFAYRACLNIPDEILQQHSIRLKCWQVAFNGAEPVDPDTLAAFSTKFAPYGFVERRFAACYGLAEATLHVSSSFKTRRPTFLAVNRESLQHNQVEVRFPGKLGTQLYVGHGFAGDAVKIVDPAKQQLAAPNSVGEIWVGGPHVSPGYWGQEDATRKTFRARLHGETHYLRTGDLGFIHRGELYITGRIKDLILIRGKNHHPQDLERTAQAAHSSFAGMPNAAFSVPDPSTDQSSPPDRLVLLQEIPKTIASAESELIDALRIAVVQSHRLNVTDIFLLAAGALPHTPSGKLRRRECLRRYLAQEFSPRFEWHSATMETPGTHSEQLTADPFHAPLDLASLEPNEARIAIRDWMMRKVAAALQLPLEELSPDMHFGLYGLDSITTVELTVELSEALRLDLEDNVFWDYPNFNLLSSHLAKLRETAGAALARP